MAKLSVSGGLLVALALGACAPPPPAALAAARCTDPHRSFTCFEPRPWRAEPPKREPLCRSDPNRCPELPTLRERSERR